MFMMRDPSIVTAGVSLLCSMVAGADIVDVCGPTVAVVPGVTVPTIADVPGVAVPTVAGVTVPTVADVPGVTVPCLANDIAGPVQAVSEFNSLCVFLFMLCGLYL